MTASPTAIDQLTAPADSILVAAARSSGVDHELAPGIGPHNLQYVMLHAEDLYLITDPAEQEAFSREIGVGFQDSAAAHSLAVQVSCSIQLPAS